jgi:hypothetical protein
VGPASPRREQKGRSRSVSNRLPALRRVVGAERYRVVSPHHYAGYRVVNGAAHDSAHSHKLDRSRWAKWMILDACTTQQSDTDPTAAGTALMSRSANRSIGGLVDLVASQPWVKAALRRLHHRRTSPHSNSGAESGKGRGRRRRAGGGEAGLVRPRLDPFNQLWTTEYDRAADEQPDGDD